MMPWKTPKPPRELDVRGIRAACERFGYGQSTFAGVLGVSVRTLQGWEQGRRKPGGPARALLIVIAHDPTAYFNAIAAWPTLGCPGQPSDSRMGHIEGPGDLA
jgi:putative transcriptional regulator